MLLTILLALVQLTQEPKAVVARLQSELEAVMHAKDGAGSQRARLAAALDAAYDFDTLGRDALGAFFEELTESQRTELARALREYALAEHAARLADAGEGHFTAPADEKIEGERALVAARFEQADTQPLALTYELVPAGDTWRVVDVRTSNGEGRAQLAGELQGMFEIQGPNGPVYWLTGQTTRLAESPRAVVERLQAGLIGLMRAAETVALPFDREGSIAPLFDDTHDIDAIAELSLKDHWAKLEPVHRAEFTAQLRRLAIATYAGRFTSYSGERFQVDSDQPVRGGGAMVRTALVRKNGERVTLDYLLHKTRGRWKILNIVADGVSDLALKRAEYASLMEREGFAGLLETLREQTLRQK